MDFVSSLRPEHLQSFWYSASKYNFAVIGTFVSLLWATATDKDEADMYRKCLDEYRWVLRLSSKSAEFLERAIGMLSTSTGVLVRAIPDHPDADRILSRHLCRTRLEAPVHHTLARQDSYVASVVYRSESELYDDASPDNIAGDTPSDTGLLASMWDVDHAWLGVLGQVESGFDEGQGQNDMSNENLDLSIAQAEFDDGQLLRSSSML
jgi:hypothetical protein